MTPQTDDAPLVEPEVEVTVTRTGGFAGLRREWHAEPPASDAAEWVELIADCPWEETAPEPSHEPSPGADLFVWRIRARCATTAGTVRHDAELHDPHVAGPWRTLIDAVRDAAD
ncbi:protealysin inhibitor emfourin [Microbacterium sp.]|uniref:protealysin inhibitor emfourin n=1 Tax=Microbacterium sp. TaxID=51671 RepID=UPI0039E6A5E5